jgi:hypothetical protein
MLVRTCMSQAAARGRFWRGNLDQLGASQLSAMRTILHTSAGNCRRKIFPVKLHAVIDSVIFLPAPIYTLIKAEAYAPILRLTCGAGLSRACGFLA